MNIIILDYGENFISFLDPDRVKVVEENSIEGIRTIDVEYSLIDIDEEGDLQGLKLSEFEDSEADLIGEDADNYVSENVNELFKMGNKIFINGDKNVCDCLYVIDTQVKRDYFKENMVSFTAEEVLVELNYAPLFSQTDLTTKNGFTISKNNGEDNVKVNYNALDFWFGDYFNIGIVQDCLSEQISKISPSGTMTLMELLRFIEEETCNVFMTRYEKDVKTNTIHRFLDFLNPDDNDKHWEVNFTYTPPAEDDNIQHLPENIYFRIADEDDVTLEEYNAADDLGITTTTTDTSIKLTYTANKTITINNTNYSPHTVVITIGKNTYTLDSDASQTAGDLKQVQTTVTTENTFFDFENELPNHSIFEVYDVELEESLYRHELNPSCGDTHTKVLDLGYNTENIEYELDETDAFEAIAPVIKFQKGEGESTTDLTKNDIGTIITNWKNLSVNKGDTIPMIVQKVNDSIGPTTAHMSVSDVSSNYFSRPLKPNDQDEKYEYWKGTAYWKAPFTKYKGDLFIQQDGEPVIQYNGIRDKADTTNNYGATVNPKTGTLETTQEDVYAIYNEIANKLKEKKEPSIDIQIDVADYKNGEYNNYQVYDKVYIKIPGKQGLVTAIVKTTKKDLHDIGANTVELTNFSIGTKVSTIETILLGDNLSIKYPKHGTLEVTLQEEESDTILSGQLLNFTLYTVDENGSNTFKKNYTKKTNSKGKATLTFTGKPANYVVEVNFGGTVKYSSCTATYDVNISGTVTQSTTSTTSQSSSTKKKKYKTVKTYWTKCGLSPDKKEIVAIAKPSGLTRFWSNKKDASGNKLKSTWYKTVFKNKCPYCGKTGTLRYDGQKANKGCITSAGARGRGYKKNIPECEITCSHCDMDFDGVTGIEKMYDGKFKLTTIKKPVKSNTTTKAKLCKGKLQYGTKKVEIKEKTTTAKADKSKLTHLASYDKTVGEWALKKAGSGTPLSQLKKLAKACGSRIHYCKPMYKNFKKSPKSVYTSKSANCCDQARFFLMCCDAAGLSEYFKLQYITVCCNRSNGIGHCFTKITNKKTGNSVYVDPCKNANAYGHYVTGWGRPGSGGLYNYPNKPYS